MSLMPVNIFGYDQRGGLQTNKKPVWIPENAFQKLINAYVYRDRVRKREGIKILGRFQRILTSQSLGMTVAGPPNTVVIANIFATLGITEPNAEIAPGSLVITVGPPDTATFTDLGNGNFSVTGFGVAAGSYVNYVTGRVVLQFSALTGGATITANINYYPSLPSMGILQREIATINDEQTIWFDTKYAYIWNGTSFQEFIPGTTWDGGNSDFFWATNYRGVNPQDRLFFVTNFSNTAGSPMRYTNGTTWTTFNPVLAANESVTENVGSIVGSGTTFSGTLPNAPLLPGSLIITVAGITFSDPTGSGTLTGDPVTNTGTINYLNGNFTLNFNPTINFSGSISNITTPVPNGVVTTTVAHNLTTGAEITITGVLGTVGAVVNDKEFTITVLTPTTFELNAATTGTYTANTGTWALTNDSTTVTAVYQTSSSFLFQARILIPYFGRLLALNVWEGASLAGSVNIFNRCRFSQVGSPVDSEAWRTDIFGRGGFLDAPTNEEIIGCTFLNNTLIVFFEKTTWQLRYVGEYGLPFIWERIASDLGSESTFSPVLFNRGILAIGDKAIITADSNSVTRIDLDIPDQIFNFQNSNEGVKRVQGIRDYQKELVYWNYADAQTQAAPGVDTTFPNKVLVYNYRNETWAIFRDNVTAFGTFQLTNNITWDSQVVYWDSQVVTWDDFDTQSRFPIIVSGNQQGFAHYYQLEGQGGTPIVNANEQPSLSITGVSVTASILALTIPNHNLQTGEIIYVSNLQFIDSTTFLPVATDLNNKIYLVSVPSNQPNVVNLFRWDFVDQAYEINFSFTPNLATATYIGGGMVTLFQPIEVQTKDFNPFQQKGIQTKLSYIDFLMDVTSPASIGIITGATNTNPCVITSANHGLISGQNIFISSVSGMTQLNTSNYYTVTVINANSFSIDINATNFGTYTGGGQWMLAIAGMSLQLFLNSSPAISGNLIVGNRQLQTSQVPPFYGPASDYAWHRFYSTCVGQYFNVLMTYDANLMNTLATHQRDWVLNAMTLWVRPGGKQVF